MENAQRYEEFLKGAAVALLGAQQAAELVAEPDKRAKLLAEIGDANTRAAQASRH